MLTVIIHSHNNLDTLNTAIASAEKHSKRIIVVDDSSDETAELLKTYPQIELLTTDNTTAYLDLLYYNDWFLTLNADEELIGVISDNFKAPYSYVRIFKAEQPERADYEVRLFQYKPGMRLFKDGVNYGFDYYNFENKNEVASPAGVIKKQQ